MTNISRTTKLLQYSPIIDRPEGGFTREEKLQWQDDMHRRLFPEKYDARGNRVDL
jgi:hypothetical protein